MRLQYKYCIKLGDKSIWGRISSVIRLKILFENIISDRIYEDIPHQMKNLHIVIPILKYFLIINIKNASFFMKRERHGVMYNHNVNQSQGTLLMTSGF